MPNAQPYAQQRPIQSLHFYVLALDLGRDRLTQTKKHVLLAVADCYRRRKPFQPSLASMAKMFSCSRRTVTRAIYGLEGRHGWIHNEWRGGRKTNIYSPGWRLLSLIGRERRA